MSNPLSSLTGVVQSGMEMAGGAASLEAGNIGGVGMMAQGMQSMASSLMGLGATQDQAKGIVSQVLSSVMGNQQGQGVEGQHEHHHHQQAPQNQQQQQGLSPEQFQQLTQLLQQMMQQQMQQQNQGFGNPLMQNQGIGAFE